MSLINDALKRARHAQKGPPPLPPRDSQLKPVEGLPAKPSELPVLIVIGVLVVLGIGALVVTFVIFKRGQTPFLAAAPAQPAVEAATPGSSTPVAASTPQAVSLAAMASAPATVAVTQPSKEPLPKLQGIFYSLSRPWALVDGKTILVGDRVGDFRVLAIARGSVTIGAAGQTNVLTLPQ